MTRRRAHDGWALAVGNNLDVHRHRRLTYIEQAQPAKAREEAASMGAMELSIRSMRTLIAHLEPYCAAAGGAPGTASKPPRSSRRESFGRLPSSNTSRMSLGGAGGQLPSTSDKSRLSLGAPPGTANKENQVIN